MRSLALLALVACKDDAPTDDSTTADDSGVVDTQPQRCGTALPEVPEGAVVLSHTSTPGSLTVSDFTWEPDGQNHVRDLRLNQSARFTLERPARVLGFAVQFALLPEDAEEREIAASLNADFGYNGFDFWPEAPLWQGTRCLGEITEGEWVTYGFEEPVEITHPGLVYVTHQRDGMADPAVLIATDDNGDCGTFDNCHASLNLPDVRTPILSGTQYYFWNGLSSSLQYDFKMELYVEYTDEAGDTLFHDATGGVSPSNRMSWGDYDHDGDDDLLVAGLRLYENDGAGNFTDVTAAAGLSGLSATSGGVWGDYDNDGCLDLFAFAESYTASDALLKSNCDGTFSDVTDVSGIADVQDYNLCNGDTTRDRTPTPAAAWWDIDNDGLLDLALANFICWDNYTYYKDTFFHNEGDGSFTEWTGTHGFSIARQASRGVAPIDHDQDGDVDLFINNYVLQRNLFYENNGDGTVSERAAQIGIGGHQDLGSGYYGHTIGAAWGDVNNDGQFDLISANLAHPRFWDFSNKSQVLLSDGDGTYTDLGGDWSDPLHNPTGLRYQETYSVPVLADFNNDGNLDLAISAVYDGRPTDFYWGVGDGTFTLDAWRSGITTRNGWGMAVADFDQDGDPDLATRDEVLRNDQTEGGHWLQVRAIGGVHSNWGGYGATVRARVGDTTVVRHVQGGSGQGNQDSATVHFGLGDVTTVDALEVDYPGGGTVTFDGPFDADQKVWVFEAGDTHLGWAPPER